jgi:hypothetical protein
MQKLLRIDSKLSQLSGYLSSHRFAAAFFAIAFRFAAESFSALALPPLDAPSLESATAWGLRVSFGGGDPGGKIAGPLPVAASTTALAICVKSRRVLAREGMLPASHGSAPASNYFRFKLNQYPSPADESRCCTSAFTRSGSSALACSITAHTDSP